MEPTVSVIIPMYNSRRYIRETLSGIFNQTYRPSEIIAIDDGSTDGTGDVVSKYGSKVRLIRGRNGGISAARNRGIRRARGKYVAFCDSDDVWHPQKLENQVNLLESMPDVPLCSCHLQQFPDGDPLPSIVPGKEFLIYSGRRLIMRNCMQTSSVVVRREALQGMWFDETLQGPEDWDMWRRILAARKWVHLPESCGWYRVRKDSISRDAAKLFKANCRVLKKTFREVPGITLIQKFQAISYLHFDAAMEFRNNHFVQSAKHLLQSLLLWPLKFDDNSKKSFCRAKFAIVLLMMILRLRQNNVMRTEVTEQSEASS